MLAALALALACFRRGGRERAGGRLPRVRVQDARGPERPGGRVERVEDRRVRRYAEDTCSQPTGALVAALGDQPMRTANTDIATWAFSAPAGATIAGATLWRAGDADGGAAINATYQFWLAGPSETEHLRRMPVRAGMHRQGRISGSPCPPKTVWSCRAPIWAHTST